MGLNRCIALSCAIVLAPYQSDAQSTVLRIWSDQGHVIPYAVVTVGGTQRIADTAGTVSISRLRADSLLVEVRRIGFKPFAGWLLMSSDSLRVTLSASVQSLQEVEVIASRNTPLARTGFYDRSERVQRGAIVGEFLPPEYLDRRSATQVSQLLLGSRYVRIGRTNTGHPILLGRGGCGMTVLLDGARVSGTYEEGWVGEAPQSVNPAGTHSPASGPKMSIDQLVAGNDIMAIEVYPSTANAPVELIRASGRGSCGIVALWTGGRH